MSMSIQLPTITNTQKRATRCAAVRALSVEDILEVVARYAEEDERSLQLVNKDWWRINARKVYRNVQGQEPEAHLPPGSREHYRSLVRSISFQTDTPDFVKISQYKYYYPFLTSIAIRGLRNKHPSYAISLPYEGKEPITCHRRSVIYAPHRSLELPSTPWLTTDRCTLIDTDPSAWPYVSPTNQEAFKDALYLSSVVNPHVDGIKLVEIEADVQALASMLYVRAQTASVPALHTLELSAQNNGTIKNLVTILAHAGADLHTFASRPAARAFQMYDITFQQLPRIGRILRQRSPHVKNLTIGLTPYSMPQLLREQVRFCKPIQAHAPLEMGNGRIESLMIDICRQEKRSNHHNDFHLDCLDHLPFFAFVTTLAALTARKAVIEVRGLFYPYRAVQKLESELVKSVDSLHTLTQAEFEALQALPSDDLAACRSHADLLTLILAIRIPSVPLITPSALVSARMAYSRILAIQSFLARAVDMVDTVMPVTSHSERARALRKEYARRRVEPYVSSAQGEFHDAFVRVMREGTGTLVDVCGRVEKGSSEGDREAFERDHPGLARELLWEAARYLGKTDSMAI